jgi:hypothetical protein
MRLPLWIDKLGTMILGYSPPGHNAITLGNHCLFSRRLRTGPPGLAEEHIQDTAWLIHELMHVWQYQNFGPRYLYWAIRAYLRRGEKVYDYQIPDPAEKSPFNIPSFFDLNPEQQGDVGRDYYLRLKKDRDTSAWDPLIEQMKSYRPPVR